MKQIQEAGGTINPAYTYLAKVSPASRRVQEKALSDIADILGYQSCFDARWDSVTYEEALIVREVLSSKYRTNTTNRYLSAFRNVLKESMIVGLIDHEKFIKLLEALKNFKGSGLKSGRHITDDEIRAMLETCLADPPTYANCRDFAIIALLYASGIRCAEACHINIGDVSQNGEIKIYGKGNKWRTIYVANTTLLGITNWIDCINETTGNLSGPLFVRIKKSDKIVPDGRLTTSGITFILQSRATQAGVGKITPHDFRRTFVGNALSAGVDVSTVAAITGHSDLNTVKGYDLRPDTAKKAVAKNITLPIE